MELRARDTESNKQFDPGERMWFVAMALMACSGGGGATSLADCETMAVGTKSDECWAEHAAELFREDAQKGIETVEQKVQDQRVKDFIWLTVTREVDPGSYKYCDRIQEEALAERCRVLVSRPHLHRELLKGGEGGAPGGPPGGPQGGPPGGPQGGPPQGGAPPPGGAPQ